MTSLADIVAERFRRPRALIALASSRAQRDDEWSWARIARSDAP